MRALRAENAGLRRKLEQAETLHEAMVGRQAGGRGAAGCDERRVAVLQAQHLQLRRQVRPPSPSDPPQPALPRQLVGRTRSGINRLFLDAHGAASFGLPPAALVELVEV